MKRLVFVCGICVLCVMPFSLFAVAGQSLFKLSLDQKTCLDDWTQLGVGEWSVYLEDNDFGVLRHVFETSDESVIFYEKYELPLAFEVSAKIKGASGASMYAWKGLVFYVNDSQFYVVRFSYDREEHNVQCNRYKYEDGKIVRTSYSGGTLPNVIPAGEEVEIAITRQLYRVDITINGVPAPFTPDLMSLPAGAKVGFYNIALKSDTYFWDIEVKSL